MQASRSLNCLAVFVIAGLVATLGIRLWASFKGADIHGPSLVAASQNAVFVCMDMQLVQLDGDGRLLRQFDLRAAGFENPPCDMQALSDKRILLGNYNSRAILACDLDQWDCRPLFHLPPVNAREHPASLVDSHSFDFFLDEASARLFITEAARHALYVAELPGGPLTTLLDQEDLRYPNDLWMDGNGLVRVADTFGRRIASLEVEGTDFRHFINDMPAKTEVGRADRHFPIGLIQARDQRWWVLNADRRLLNADLILYDATGYPQRRIALPDSADPGSLAVFQNLLLVADPVRFNIHAVDTKTDTVSIFGDEAFAQTVAKIQARADLYRRLARSAFMLMGVFIAFAIMIVFVSLRSKRAVEAENTVEQIRYAAGRTSGSVNWIAFSLEALKAHQRTLLLIKIVFGAVSIIGIAMILVVINATGSKDWRLLALTGAPAVLPLVLIFCHKALIPQPVRIGTDGVCFYFCDARGRIRQAPFSEIEYSERWIRSQGIVIPLEIQRWLPLYEQGDYEKHLRPLLLKARKISNLRMALGTVKEKLVLLAVAFVLVLLLSGLDLHG